jgi:hypothetical protein
MNYKIRILIGVLLIAFPASALAFTSCRDTGLGCTLEQLTQLNNGAEALGLAKEERIAILLEMVQKLQAILIQLQYASASGISTDCLDITQDLYIGKTDEVTNGEVSKLQRFLGAYKLSVMDPNGDSGIPPEELQPVTGYYGNITAANVMGWQKAHGMDFVNLTSGVGPMTRGKMKCSNVDLPEITKVSWRIEPANPGAADSYKKDEQRIFIDVIRADNSVRGYDLGTSFGCTGSTDVSSQDKGRVLGQVHCYYALSGVSFLAYTRDGTFIVEKGVESARDGSIQKTVVLEI